mgnify:FL=1
MDEFKEKLKIARKAAKLTQKNIAETLGIVESAYANWEQGRTQPNIENIRKLSEILKVDLNFLLNKPDYPEIKKANFPYDMSAWFNEKIHSAMKNLSHHIDSIKQSKSQKLKEELLEDNGYLSETVYYLLKLLINIGGVKNNDDFDYKIIVNNGYDGYLQLMDKYNISQNDLNKLFVRDKNQ